LGGYSIKKEADYYSWRKQTWWKRLNNPKGRFLPNFQKRGANLLDYFTFFLSHSTEFRMVFLFKKVWKLGN